MNLSTKDVFSKDSVFSRILQGIKYPSTTAYYPFKTAIGQNINRFWLCKLEYYRSLLRFLEMKDPNSKGFQRKILDFLKTIEIKISKAYEGL